MTFQIWKFPLPNTDNLIEMPLLASPLSLHLQNGVPTMWARVNPTLPLEKRRFVIIMTGQDLPSGLRQFLGTLLMLNDGFVVHCFEIDP